MRPAVEHKATSDGTILFRWKCPACGRTGVWLTQITDVERNASIHARSVHSERSAA